MKRDVGKPAVKHFPTARGYIIRHQLLIWPLKNVFFI